MIGILRGKISWFSVKKTVFRARKKTAKKYEYSRVCLLDHSEGIGTNTKKNKNKKCRRKLCSLELRVGRTPQLKTNR